MNLMQQVKRDVLEITSNLNDFGLALTFLAPNLQTATIVGISVNHSSTFDEMGNPITGSVVVATVSEQLLIDAGYTTRNAKNQADFTNHLVTITFADSQVITHRVFECRPDYSINLFTFFLEVINNA
jgi:hypothetical protein